MTQITIISEHKSPRLDYVLNWLFNAVFHLPYTVVTPGTSVPVNHFTIGYGTWGNLTIPDGGLLWEKEVGTHDINTGEWADVPTLYHAEHSTGLPFDLFSAVFFLLSRHEEYYPFSPDKHGRYPPGQSLMYKKGWLRRPLIDEWIWALYNTLRYDHGLDITLDPFRFTPTYDIDIAYSYRHKGWQRTIGAAAKDLLHGNFKAVTDRMKVISGRQNDPYDCFGWLTKKHKELDLRPIYFMLMAHNTTAYDKNNAPHSSAMQQLIKKLSGEGETGIHPSYHSDNEKIFREELSLLEKTTGKTVRISRQHYIRLQLPKTYGDLIERGIEEDYSMGYGSKLGFRAGTGRSFPWYDLQQELQTSLVVHPFCFMDSTAHYEEKLGTRVAMEQLLQMKATLQQTHSQMITVFHNFSLGTDSEWKGWNNLYASFLEQVSGKGFIA